MLGAWKLAGYEIQLSKGGEYIWGAYMDEHPEAEDEHQFTPFIGLFVGWTRLVDDVLIMSPWKVHDKADDDLKTWDDVEKRMASLPKWDKTKYFLKHYDLGGPCIFEVGTDEPVDKDTAMAIAKRIGLLK